MNNNSKKQTMDNKVFWPFCFIMGAVMAFQCAIMYEWRQISNEQKYIVTNKGAYKISYQALSGDTMTHVMTFDSDVGGFYQYINVGDTITGWKNIMKKPVAPSLRAGSLEPAIKSVNGYNLTQLRQFTRRDSMLRDMTQKKR